MALRAARMGDAGESGSGVDRLTERIITVDPLKRRLIRAAQSAIRAHPC
jgi:hypothetical protein